MEMISALGGAKDITLQQGIITEYQNSLEMVFSVLCSEIILYCTW